MDDMIQSDSLEWIGYERGICTRSRRQPDELLSECITIYQVPAMTAVCSGRLRTGTTGTQGDAPATWAGEYTWWTYRVCINTIKSKEEQVLPLNQSVSTSTHGTHRKPFYIILRAHTTTSSTGIYSPSHCFTTAHQHTDDLVVQFTIYSVRWWSSSVLGFNELQAPTDLIAISGSAAAACCWAAADVMMGDALDYVWKLNWDGPVKKKTLEKREGRTSLPGVCRSVHFNPKG